jgi:hypothetical protein
MPIIGTIASSNTKYPIGSIGPGGGIVFYDAGSYLSWGRYLEAAVSTTSPSWTDVKGAWSGNTTTAIGTTSTAIGTGMSNTLAMVAQSSTANKAATICRAYTGGGYSSSTDGWFLPSKDELNQLYIRRAIVGGFSTATNALYWSSSEFFASGSWAHNFDTGAQSVGAKTNNSYIRPIRAF